MDWGLLAYVSAGPSVVFVALYALVLSWREHLRQKGTVDHFISARKSSGPALLAFSFFAASMGSWAATAPASYAAVSGLLGLAVYSISLGVPLVVVARLGDWASATYPESTSLSHFLQWRFSCQGDSVSGRPIAVVAVLVMLFNMTVSLLAEYVTIGALFRDFVGVDPVLPVVCMSLLTMSYTAAGGLYVSILTDRVQAIATIILTIGLAVYLSIYFSPGSLPPITSSQAGFTYEGYSSIFSMPASLLSTSLFSEAIWQRVWAAENSAALHKGAWLGAVAIVMVVFFFGFVGFLSLWAMRATTNTDSNLYFFSIFNSSGTPSVALSNWSGLIAMVCTCVMSEGAIDSLQNGIVATISSNFFRSRPLLVTRMMVVCINAPLIFLATANYVTSVLSLFLSTNLLCTCWLIPLVLCLAYHPAIRGLLTEGAVLFGGFFGMLALCAMGWIRAGTFADGLYLAWLGNDYGAEWFAIAMGGSLVGIIFGVAIRVVRGYSAHAPGRTRWIRNMFVGSPYDKDIDDAPLLRQAQFVQQFSPRTPSPRRNPLKANTLPTHVSEARQAQSRAASM